MASLGKDKLFSVEGNLFDVIDRGGKIKFLKVKPASADVLWKLKNEKINSN